MPRKKNIRIAHNNYRQQLPLLFKESMSHFIQAAYKNIYNGDDYYGEDDSYYDDYYNNRYNNIIGFNNEDDEIDIYFYYDVDCANQYSHFKSVRELTEFCDENGIIIDDSVREDLQWTSTYHCCMNLATQSLIGAYTYSALRYSYNTAETYGRQ